MGRGPMVYLITIGLAIVFYYIGNSDYYNKGWLLAILSFICSSLGLATGLSLVGAVGANVILYLILLIYNLISKKPPGSSSGF
jgi:hypothetical protein